jgi:epoxide hydrolase 4
LLDAASGSKYPDLSPGRQETALNMTIMEHSFVQLSEVRLHYVRQGGGPLLVLLHGFPDNWRIWRRQIDYLSQYFEVVAPDLRGYDQSDRPQGLDAYRSDRLANDIAELIVSMGVGRAFVAGHDWGGALAWTLAGQRPDLVERLSILNCPHPAAFARHLLTSPNQLKRSWYIFYFQLPWLPEWTLRRNLRAMLKKGYKLNSTDPGAFTEEDLEQSALALEAPGALTAALNYYRAALRRPGPVRLPIRVPTQIIWGQKDAALDMRLSWLSAKHVEAPLQLNLLPEAGHWVQVDAAHEVNSLLRSYFS